MPGLDLERDVVDGGDVVEALREPLDRTSGVPPSGRAPSVIRSSTAMRNRLPRRRVGDHEHRRLRYLKELVRHRTYDGARSGLSP